MNYWSFEFLNHLWPEEPISCQLSTTYVSWQHNNLWRVDCAELYFVFTKPVCLVYTSVLCTTIARINKSGQTLACVLDLFYRNVSSVLVSTSLFLTHRPFFTVYHNSAVLFINTYAISPAGLTMFFCPPSVCLPILMSIRLNLDRLAYSSARLCPVGVIGPISVCLPYPLL